MWSSQESPHHNAGDAALTAAAVTTACAGQTPAPGRRAWLRVTSVLHRDPPVGGRHGKILFAKSLLLTLCGAVLGLGAPTRATLPWPLARPPLSSQASGPVFSADSFRTNVDKYAESHVPRYERFELAFTFLETTATNPYFPYDPAPPPGVERAVGITVDLLLLPPGQTSWAAALRVPCFFHQPVEEVAEGMVAVFLPTGNPEWRCRFTPESTGLWRYLVRATDAAGTSESAGGSFDCAPSHHSGFIGISKRDTRFFEFSDGRPFVTPLINLEQGSPFNTLAGIRENIRHMGANGIRFVRWFPTGEGANFFVAPYGDTMRINWHFGEGQVTADDADAAAGKLFSYNPYYYSTQTVLPAPGFRYRLSFAAKVTGEQVLRAQLGAFAGGTVDVCSTDERLHRLSGETCTYRRTGWRTYKILVEGIDAPATPVEISLRGLYVSFSAPKPYDRTRPGSIGLHSIRFQRDETGNGDWGGNLLTRSDPDTFGYVDQQAAAMLDEVLRQSELHGVYHKLTLFHKNDALLARFLPDGSVGDAEISNFYAAGGEATRWYAEAYARYFVGRWSYSTALHSLELANENNFDARAQDAAFAIAQVIRDLSPRHILQSNSFWGWWIDGFWTDPARGHLMDYSDQHWYANQRGGACDADGNHCELISNLWDDSAAYVRECARRFDAYRETFDYGKPIVRGEGGVALSKLESQHPDIARDAGGTYYHKKLWAHVGILGGTCDGEWYPRLFVEEGSGAFPNAHRDLYRMFAAYERFMAGERLSNGSYVEIGTDLTGDRGIVLRDTGGDLRAWGVQSRTTRRTLLWVDNAADTWTAAVEGGTIPAASGTLEVAGFQPLRTYKVEWWDPYAAAAGRRRVSLTTACPEGSLALVVNELRRDVALKVAAYVAHRGYLPLTLITHTR